MYGTLDNGALRIAPKKVNYADTIIYNPSSDVYEELGYYPIEHTEAPNDAPDEYHYESSWEQEEDAIVQVWNLVEDSDFIDEFEALEIILGGAL